MVEVAFITFGGGQTICMPFFAPAAVVGSPALGRFCEVVDGMKKRRFCVPTCRPSPVELKGPAADSSKGRQMERWANRRRKMQGSAVAIRCRRG